MTQIPDSIYDIPTVQDLKACRETVWIDPDRQSIELCREAAGLSMADIEDAQNRLARFAPFIRKCFPETGERGGLIESPLVFVPGMQKELQAAGAKLTGRLMLKMDSHLAIAGSVKARGGIYEVLKHAEDLALESGRLHITDDYAVLAEPQFREFFSQYTVQVGSTGNLGLSIGIMSAAIGFRVIVHMSADAKQWKKDLLRSKGVEVREYESDYSQAVKSGRQLSDADPMSYFVDDENSRTLFLGYAVAAKRLQQQLKEQDVTVDEDHPLFVYIPCGVGGAPGGISFGLRQVFGDAVHCFFVEPTRCPCMILGMSTGLNSDICVYDIGLDGITDADGLACGRPSGFVGGVMKPLLSGDMTLDDRRLYDYLRMLDRSEHIFLEPSACAAFHGPAVIMNDARCLAYIRTQDLEDKMADSTHIAWATGGSLVPEPMRREYLETFLK